MNQVKRRQLLKLIHWTMFPLVVWFLLVGPPEAMAMGSFGFAIHSNLALIFVTLCLLWTGDFMRNGLATMRTPKLPNWAQRLHWWMHRLIIWGLFFVALTGFLLGLTSSRLLKAGGFLPIAPPLGLPELNTLVGKIHTIEFYGLAALIVVHATFHLWRHLYLKDNALRIMTPRFMHRFL